MSLLIILVLILATLLILLAVSLARREPDQMAVDVTRSGNGTSHRDFTENNR